MPKRKETAAERKRREAVASMAADIRWIFSGAIGREFNAGDDIASTEDLERIIPAVCGHYDIPFDRAAPMILRSLDRWCCPDTVAEWIHDRAVDIKRWRKARDAEASPAGGNS